MFSGVPSGASLLFILYALYAFSEVPVSAFYTVICML